MGCATSVPSGKRRQQAKDGDVSRRELLLSSETANSAPPSPTTVAASLLANSAFFSGLDTLDRTALAASAVEDHATSSKKIPLTQPEALLLGGVDLLWDMFSTHHGMVTTRLDVVGEECLLRPLESPTWQSGSNLTVEDVMFGDGSNARNEIEYLSAERLIDSDEMKNKPWFVLPTNAVRNLAQQSKSFETFFLQKLRPRAMLRVDPVGFLRLLSDSEKPLLLQTFDYVTLRKLAETYSNDPCYFIVCDGSLKASLEDTGVSLEVGMKERNRIRKSGTDLTTSPISMHKKSGSESNLSRSFDRVPSFPRMRRSMDYVLTAGCTFGEASIILESSKTNAKFEVVEDGVAFMLKRQYWELFFSTVSGERTRQLVPEEQEYRSNGNKIRSLIPSLRKCKASTLRLLMDTCEVISVDHTEQSVRPGYVNFVRKGSVKVFDPVHDRETIVLTGQCFDFEAMFSSNSARKSLPDSVVLLDLNKGESNVKTVCAMGRTRGTSEVEGTPRMGKKQLQGASLWRFPVTFFRAALDSDSVFAADFEFIVKMSQDGFNASPKRTSGHSLAKAFPVSFTSVLNHPVAVLHFSKYLDSIVAKENLDFYWAVECFPKTPEEVARDLQARWNEDPDKESYDSLLNGSSLSPSISPGRTRSRILEIVREFADEKAPTPINVNSNINKTLRAALTDETVVHQKVLEGARDEVYSILLTDSFPRFITSGEPFLEMMSEILEEIDSPLSGAKSPIAQSRSSHVGASPMKGYLSKPSTPLHSARKSLFGSQRGSAFHSRMGSEPFSAENVEG